MKDIGIKNGQRVADHLIKKHNKSKSSFFKISKMHMTDLFKKKEKTQISRIKNGKYA